MFILFDFWTEVWGILRKVFLLIDSIGLTFIDDAYDLIIGAATAFDGTEVAKLASEISKNCYIIIGIFALFRIALMLINAIINPDKLTDKQEGYGNMLSRLIITIVLFIAVPIIFDLSRELQSEIINNNYISKILIGKELIGSGASNGNPGQQMKDIAVRTLIYPDSRLAESNSTEFVAVENSPCAGDSACEAAIDAWNADVSYNTLNMYISSYVEDGDDMIMVYHYTPFVTLIVGIFITYVLFSFAIDIALRSVELVVLEVLSPLFIVTYIDPKQGSKGTFSKWLSACGKTYLNLFIRIAVICLMLLLISKMNSLFKIATGSKGLLQLLMIIAILIFAKKAPKWLGDILGIDGGSLGGLGIGKKLAGAALVGGAINRGARTAAGGVIGAVRSANASRKANKANRKLAGETAGERAKRTFNNNKDLSFGKRIGKTAGTYFNPKENIRAIGKGALVGAVGATKGLTTGIKAGFDSKDMKDLNAKVKTDSTSLLGKYAPGYKSVAQRAGGKIGGFTDNLLDSRLGNSFEQADRLDTARKNEKGSAMYGNLKFGNDGKRNTNINPVNAKEVNASINSLKTQGYNISASNIEGISGAIVASCNIPGIKVSTDGTMVEANGVKIPASKYCEENGLYNQYGKKELEAIAKENAQTKATNYVNNEQQISQSNQNAALAGLQKQQIENSMLAGLAVDAKNVFNGLKDAFGEQIKAIKALNDAKANGASEEEQIRLEKAVKDVGKKVETATEEARKSKDIDQSMLESYISASATQMESINTVSVLTSQNANIRLEIEKDIKLSKDSKEYESNFVVKDKTTSETFEFMKDPTQIKRVLDLMSQATSSAKEDAEKLKPKKE